MTVGDGEKTGKGEFGIVNGSGDVFSPDSVISQKSKTRRPRSMTVVKLQWVAERVRKIERIKAELQAGSYHVENRAVAKALLGIEDENEVKLSD